MAAIGILGGMGPQASNKLYELIIIKTANYTQAAVDEDYPEIVLLNVPVPNFISDKTKIKEAEQMLVKRTKLLKQAGCTINGIACNTVHLLLPVLEAATDVPFVSLPKLVNARIIASGYKRIGLLATPTTIKSTLYDDAITQGEIVRPGEMLIDKTEGYIYKQLSGKLTIKDRNDFRKLVDIFRQDNELDAVILGCTELPLVYGSCEDENILDTLDILADALLDKYFANR